MAKIEEVKEIFDRWRNQERGRAMPQAMRQMVVDLIGEYTLTRICRELNLTMSNVKKWKVKLAEDRAFLQSGTRSTEIVVQGLGEPKSVNNENEKPLNQRGMGIKLLRHLLGMGQPPALILNHLQVEAGEKRKRRGDTITADVELLILQTQFTVILLIPISITLESFAVSARPVAFTRIMANGTGSRASLSQEWSSLTTRFGAARFVRNPIQPQLPPTF
jgi:hypothetical protein